LQEFYIKCQASQDFIITQIPWATAGADRSREERIIQLSVMSEAEQNQLMNEQTVEEQLLSELLDAHEVLLESLRMYEDLQRIGMERQAEILSRQETRMPRSVGCTVRVLIREINQSDSKYHTWTQTALALLTTVQSVDRTNLPPTALIWDSP
jgi:hypothetical protein